MRRTIIIAALLALVASLPLTAQSTLSRVYKDLEIDLWTDRDDGSNYEEGEEITIYFRASRDCFVTIYDLDTRGNINLLFPETPEANNYIAGGEVYVLPDPAEDYVFTVSGPPGHEYLQMVASTEPFPVPQWEAPISVYDDYWPFEYEDDVDEFLFKINSRFFPIENIAFDQVSFYVAPNYYYQRTYSDCSGDCGVVYVDYPRGCDVYIDGIYWGAAPLWIPSIYLGRHRVSVYWGTSLVYHDWIYVDYYDPYFVYPRPHFIYTYTYRHWYPYRYYDYFYGPSKYKYKQRSYYAYGPLDPKPGYKVVANKHTHYKKSKTYSTAKIKRLDTFKAKYGYKSKGPDHGSKSLKTKTTYTDGTSKRKSTLKRPATDATDWKGYGTKGSGTATTKGADVRTRTKEPVKQGAETRKGTTTSKKPVKSTDTKVDKKKAGGNPKGSSDGKTSKRPTPRKSTRGSGDYKSKGVFERSTKVGGSYQSKSSTRYQSSDSKSVRSKPTRKAGIAPKSSSSHRSKSSSSYKQPTTPRKSSGTVKAPTRSSGYKDKSVTSKRSGGSSKSGAGSSSKQASGAKKSSGGNKKKK
jgi:hypothetical protein